MNVVTNPCKERMWRRIDHNVEITARSPETPGIAFTDGQCGTLVEILLINIGFERAARLAGHDEQSLGNVDPLFEGTNLLGIG